MKKILLFALPLLAMCFASCEKEWTDDSPIIQFKDPKFLEELLSEMIDNDGHSVFADKNADGQISEKEASIIEFLNLEGKGIRNLEEIKYFTALKELYCGGNQFTSPDLSNNTALTSLSCWSNQLTSLDVSNNTALTELYCDDNQLTSLDLNKNTALTVLRCYENQLTSLDVSNNTALTMLWCADNQLTSLDVSKNTALTSLSCSGNPLTKLILYKYHMIIDHRMSAITEEYGDIIEYAE